MKTINIFFIMFSIIAFGQNQVKIDSTFNHYFKALDLELSENKNLNENGLYFDEMTLDDGEKIYINKYANKAIIFLQEITKIKAPVKFTAQSLASYVDKETLEKWKHWYFLNKRKIKWCKKDNLPYIK
ncbi:hypothetical protein [Flavobacterium sp.]|jgi:hypothetical protein|uniref:hypothetical protein n=1 Tax=Flavobacterium sp. TaxID=239 RepID=UPI0037C01278